MRIKVKEAKNQKRRRKKKEFTKLNEMVHETLTRSLSQCSQLQTFLFLFFFFTDPLLFPSSSRSTKPESIEICRHRRIVKWINRIGNIDLVVVELFFTLRRRRRRKQFVRCHSS